MGDNFLEGQTKNARKRRDRAMAEVQHPTLLDRPEIVRTVYTVRPVDGEQLEGGETLLVVRTGVNQHLDVLRGYLKVGTIDGDAAKALGEALSQTSGAAKIRISRVSSLSGIGQAEIRKE